MPRIRGVCFRLNIKDLNKIELNTIFQDVGDVCFRSNLSLIERYRRRGTFALGRKNKFWKDLNQTQY